ncbi:MAG TPA: sterol desaturase family protein [Rhodospirillaceae bacterium]|nr:sterol desaturase family protein [Rhodospirillaceae bacterium]
MVWAINLILLASPLAAVATVVSNALRSVIGTSPWPIAAVPAVAGAYTLAVFVAADFGAFLGHRFLHRSPLLWEFHKLHHSATVLMPFTAQRQHPVDWLVVGATAGICVGLAAGLFDWLTPGGIDAIAILGRNPGDVAFAALCLHFRHSHIRVDFGPRLDRWLVSPAMHQIHHSSDPNHYGRNFGIVLSLWDHLFGTARRPLAGESLTYGLGGEESRFTTLAACYWRPFHEVAAELIRRSTESASSRSGAPEK